MVQLHNASGCEHTCHTAGLCRDQRQAAKVKLRSARGCEQTNAVTITKDAMIKFRATRSCGTGSCQERRARKSNVQIFIGKQRRRKRGTRERLRQLLLPLPLRRRGRGSGHVQVQLPEYPESAPLLGRAVQRAEFQRHFLLFGLVPPLLLLLLLPSGSQRSSREEEEGGGVDPQPPGPPTPWPPHLQPCTPGLRPPGAAQDQSRLLAESPPCPSSVPGKLRATAL